MQGLLLAIGGGLLSKHVLLTLHSFPQFLFLFVCLFFETEFHVTQDGLNFWSSCSHLWSTGTIGMCSHTHWGVRPRASSMLGKHSTN